MSETVSKRVAGTTRFAAAGASTLAAVLLALAAADLVLAVITPVSPPPSQQRSDIVEGGELSADVEVLTRRNPFAGAPEAENAAEPLPEEDEDIPVTTAQLKLVSATPNSAGDSRAIIQTPDGRQASYRIGDQIIRGVTLQRVETWRAVILRNGRREALLLANRPEIKDPSIPEAGPFVVGDEGEPVTPDMPDTGPIELDEPIEAIEAGLPLKSYAGSLMPVLEANGFAPDDIPVAIDGTPIPDETAAIDAFLDELRVKSTIIVTVMRDGQREDVRFSLPAGSLP